MNQPVAFLAEEPAWRKQPIEQIRLLNPAFLGALLYCAADGYQQQGDRGGLPYALAFVVMPAVLQKATRDELPRAISTNLAAWLSVHPSALVGFPDRAKAIVPLVRQAIAVSCTGGLLRLNGHQIVPVASARRLNEYGKFATPEVIHCIKKAHFAGRWFAASGDYTTVMALWGVRP